MHTRLWIWVWTVWALCGVAHAQVSPSDKAAAEALFDQGLALLREGKLEEACARLEQSQSIERGIGTMLYLAECYEKSGRSASAWALFREAASEAQAAGQTERAAAGRQRAERLEPSLSRLTIEVPAEARVPGLEILRNGATLSKGVWGVALPVDPGEQQLEAHAPGYLTHTHSVSVGQGPGSVRVTIPQLKPAATPAADAASMTTAPVQSLPAESAAPAPRSEPPSERRDGRTQKLVGIVLGSAGVALLAVGTGFGVRAIGKNDDAKKTGCKGSLCDEQVGVDLSDEANKAATISTIGVVGGAALVAGGLVTYLLAPKSDRATKVAFSAGAQGASLHVGGVF
jgi:hypothetical protein